MSRFILIGHPVGHSLSPAIHEAAYRCLGVTHRYEVVDAPDENAVRTQIEALRQGDISGANVTVPHKRLALSLADEVDPSAEKVGAANVLARDTSGAIVAYNTDALGLARVLERLAPGSRCASVIGSGGAALACVVACEQLGINEVLVTARRWTYSVDPEAWPHADEFRRLGALPGLWLEASAATRKAIAQSDLVLQATSAGMQGAEPGDSLTEHLPWSEFRPATRLYDLVYNPSMTPFLKRARAHGLVAEGGLSMLVAQAQLALQIWLGQLPPAEPLMAAAEGALEGHA